MMIQIRIKIHNELESCSSVCQMLPFDGWKCSLVTASYRKRSKVEFSGEKPEGTQITKSGVGCGSVAKRGLDFFLSGSTRKYIYAERIIFYFKVTNVYLYSITEDTLFLRIFVFLFGYHF